MLTKTQIVKTTFFRHISCLLSLAALTVVFGGLSAHAETLDSGTAKTLASVNHRNLGSPATKTQAHSATTPAQVASAIAVKSAATPIPGTTLTSAAALRAETSKTVAPQVAQANGTTPGTTTPVTPAPSTTPDTTTPVTPAPSTTPGTTTPNPNQVVPGRSTRSGPSYIGVGGNFGLTGDTALGNTNFTIISKIGLTNTISVRPSVVVGDNTTFLIPITLDFPFQAAGGTGYSIAPYLGAGAAISTGGGTTGRLLLTGGIDVPITGAFTATAAVNAAVFDRTDVGLLIGVGYTFPSGF